MGVLPDGTLERVAVAVDVLVDVHVAVPVVIAVVSVLVAVVPIHAVDLGLVESPLVAAVPIHVVDLGLVETPGSTVGLPEAGDGPSGEVGGTTGGGLGVADNGFSGEDDVGACDGVDLARTVVGRIVVEEAGGAGAKAGRVVGGATLGASVGIPFKVQAEVFFVVHVFTVAFTV